METPWDIVLELSQEPFEIEQICQWLKYAPRWDEISINRVFQCKSPEFQLIVADVTNGWRVMETHWELVLELSREPFEIGQICQWLKCAPRREEQSINRVFHCYSPGSQVIVADVINGWRVMETPWDLVLELSREPFEIEQICQWLKCAQRWEEQSINRVYHSKSQEFQVIVADVSNGWREMETPWDLVLVLSREPFEIEQICQWLKCAQRWEEQSINRVYHSKSQEFQVIVADVSNGWREMETPWDLVLVLSREPFEIEQICQWLKCAPRREEQSINRVFHCYSPGSQVIVADVINGWRVMETPWDHVLELSREPFEIEQICQWLKCAPRWDEISINRVFHCKSPEFQLIVADVTNGWRVKETPWDLVLELSREPFEIEQICQWLKCAPRREKQSINWVFHCNSPGSQVIVADVINGWRVMETPSDLVLELSREPFEIKQICQWLKCAPRQEEQSINRVFHCNSQGSQVIVADVLNGWREMETPWDLVLVLSREPFEIEQICQLLRCAPRQEEQSINRVFHCNSPGSQVIVADVIMGWRVMETPWDHVLELSREPFEIEQKCQWLKCAPRWDEISINRVFHCKSPEFQLIVADVTNGWRVKETPWDLVLELSREPFEIEQICQWLKCAPRREKQSINWVFHCNSPGSQVIVADVINGWRVMETPSDLVLELSREPFEIKQICQWLKCAPRQEEQSINRVFHCNSQGSQVIVADVLNGWREMETPWDLVLVLSREPFEIEQICQLLRCAPRQEEQSINRVFHCNSPGSQVIVADVIMGWRVMETPWDHVLELSREPFEIEQKCQWLKCAPRWDEISINRVFHCKSPEFQLIVADVTNGWRVKETPWDLVLELSREPFEIEQICQWLKCAPRREKQSINWVFHCNSPGSQVIVADVLNGWREMETPWDLVLVLSREPFEIEQICQWLRCAPRQEEQSINRVFHCNSPGSQVIVADVINGWRVMETRWDLMLELSREQFEIEQICQWLKCAQRWEEQSINRVYHSKSQEFQVIVADVSNGWRVMETPWDLVLELSREPFEIGQICQWLKCAPRQEEQSINRVFHYKSPGSQVIVADVINGWRVMETPWDLKLVLSREPFEIEQICQWLKCAPRWEEQSIIIVFHCN